MGLPLNATLVSLLIRCKTAPSQSFSAHRSLTHPRRFSASRNASNRNAPMLPPPDPPGAADPGLLAGIARGGRLDGAGRAAEAPRWHQRSAARHQCSKCAAAIAIQRRWKLHCQTPRHTACLSATACVSANPTSRQRGGGDRARDDCLLTQGSPRPRDYLHRAEDSLHRAET